MTQPARIVIREVRPDDEPEVARLFAELDETSRYRRWFTGAVDLARATDWAMHPELADGVGLLATADDRVVGHGMLVTGTEGTEVAFEVAQPWRHHGIATELLERLIGTARERGIAELHADVLAENADMLAVFREHGAHLSREGSVVYVVLPVV